MADKKIITSSYTNKEGDTMTFFTVGSVKGCEVTEGINAKKSKNDSDSDEESTPRVHAVKKITKTERVERIVALRLLNKSREEIKQTMYKENFYFNNPNPASAFAGDWNSI